MTAPTSEGKLLDEPEGLLYEGTVVFTGYAQDEKQFIDALGAACIAVHERLIESPIVQPLTVGGTLRPTSYDEMIGI